MRNYKIILLHLAAVLVFASCVSGKRSLKAGDYYDAVLESVKRLREDTDNKKSTQVLTQAYPLFIDYVTTGIQNGINGDDPNKWRNAVVGYEKINYVNDQIKTSLGAMKVITQPQTRYKELADAKQKAAEEVYNEGINFMMKGSRKDYESAYYDFKAANNYSQGYKEAIEMMNQAEFKATIRVAFEEINSSRFNYGTFQPTINSVNRLFLSIKPIAQKDTVPPQQYLRIIFNNYQENRPYISSRNENLSKQIVSGQKKGADGKMVNTYQTVTANVVYYRKTITADSYASLTITDATNNTILQSLNLEGPVSWTCDWAVYKGDKRALSSTAASLIQRREIFPNADQLFNQSIQNLQNNVAQQLNAFYSQY